MLQVSLPPQHEKLAFNYAHQHPEYLSLVKPEHFEDQDYAGLYRLVTQFYERYTEVPSVHTLVQVIETQGLEQKFPERLVVEMFNSAVATYEQTYMKEFVEYWVKWRNGEGAFISAMTFLNGQKVEPGNIDDVFQRAQSIVLGGTSMTFDFDEGLDFFDMASHQMADSETFITGMGDWIDSMMGGGYTTGSLTVFGGEPNIGKSIFLSNMAASAVEQGYNTAFISCEMRGFKVIQRLGANMLNIPMSEYNDTASDVTLFQKRLHKFKNGVQRNGNIRVPGQLLVKEYPTASATANDIELYLKKVEERRGIKFKVVVIDYLNILKAFERVSADKGDVKVKLIAEALRAMGGRNGWAIVTATQFNRSGWGTSDVTMESTSESMGIPMTADTMFGILQTAHMKAENYYDLKALKTRDAGGKNDRQRFDIEYEHMRLRQNRVYANTNNHARR